MKRAGNTLTVYVGSGDGRKKVCTFNADGTITPGDGVTTSASQTNIDMWSASIKNMFATNKQNVVGLRRNNNGAQTVTYTSTFKSL